MNKLYAAASAAIVALVGWPLLAGTAWLATLADGIAVLPVLAICTVLALIGFVARRPTVAVVLFSVGLCFGLISLLSQWLFSVTAVATASTFGTITLMAVVNSLVQRIRLTEIFTESRLNDDHKQSLNATILPGVMPTLILFAQLVCVHVAAYTGYQYALVALAVPVGVLCITLRSGWFTEAKRLLDCVQTGALVCSVVALSLALMATTFVMPPENWRLSARGLFLIGEGALCLFAAFAVVLASWSLSLTQHQRLIATAAKLQAEDADVPELLRALKEGRQ